MLNLIVKNFGVLKDIDIELNKTNLFIGDNGSGKSTLAKLITVVTDFTIDEDEFVKRLKDFNIDFLNEDSFIKLEEDGKSIIEIVSLKINLSIHTKESLPKLKNIERSIEAKKLFDTINENDLDTVLNSIFEHDLFKDDEKVQKHLIKILKDKEYRNTLIDADKNITSLKSKYIPAERNLISFFSNSLSNMIKADLPLPKTILEFSAHYNSAKNEIKELDILTMKYKNINSQDRIYYGSYKDDEFLTLDNSSSGIQSALPLYLTLKYFASKHKNIIIEEPELNLYPKSQIDTVKFMIENRGESSLSIMTHSPYILSILNVLIFAYKASNTNDILNDKISTMIPKEQQIDPDAFSAYLIENGISKSIKGKSTGMIESNVIDEIGDILDDDFSELMDIYREFKNDK